MAATWTTPSLFFVLEVIVSISVQRLLQSTPMHSNIMRMLFSFNQNILCLFCLKGNHAVSYLKYIIICIHGHSVKSTLQMDRFTSHEISIILRCVTPQGLVYRTVMDLSVHDELATERKNMHRLILILCEANMDLMKHFMPSFCT